MKFNNILPLVALTTAFVLPDESITNQIAIESKKSASFLERLEGDAQDVWTDVKEAIKDTVTFTENAIDNALDVGKSSFECHASMMKFDVNGWLDSGISDFDLFDEEHPRPPPPPFHPPPPPPPPPPRHPPPPPPDHPKHPPPHHGPPHHGHPHKPNQTVYELINTSKFTTKFAKLINEFPDIVEALNGTKVNSTVFVPIDAAFEKLPEHHKKPPKELIKKALSYHLSPHFYPAPRIIFSHTIPTSLGEEALGGEPQRLRVSAGLRGISVNFYSRVIAPNIFGTNGVIHGIDSLLLPPPPGLKIIELLPGEFSTLQLGLVKTGLFSGIEKADHTGGTLFAPSNFAFKKLGPKINAFLFSKFGEKYLKALLEYHIVANQTLYSDAFYKAKGLSESEEDINDAELLGGGPPDHGPPGHGPPGHGPPGHGPPGHGFPKGQFHVDLPTLLEDKSLSIDISRWGGFITMKINGFGSVAVQDGIAKDGVIHVLSNVLIPPKTPGGLQYMGEEMDVEEFKQRLSPFVPRQEEL